ncbi:hypothetical protein [Paraglaciecola sp.]|uniref:hypothetical protein n=1 Tax=Paraglaciecola sp. TaxID=1920173 RepID=UPI0030F49CB0
MFLGKKSSELYWQAVKNYQWRVLRLSILLTVLSILIVNTISSTYLGTTKLVFSPLGSALASGAYLPFTEVVNQKELTSIYEEMLLENIAQGLLIKLKKFTLTDVDSELEKAISGYLIVAQIKQKIRTFLPFMPQQDPPSLSSKQLGMLKNNYTIERIIQSLHLRYSPSQRLVYIDYKDRSATFAIIIAKLAADLYVQSVSETQMQMFEHVQKQIKLDSPQSYPLTNTADNNTASFYKLQFPGIHRSIKLTPQEFEQLSQVASLASKHTANTNIITGHYTTQLLKPNKALIVISSFLLSVVVISSLVLILVRLKSADRQTSSSPRITGCKSSK